MRERSPLTAQIEELKREISWRGVKHPGLIASKTISRDLSELQIGRLEDALKTLVFVRDNREKIEAATGVRVP